MVGESVGAWDCPSVSFDAFVINAFVREYGGVFVGDAVDAIRIVVVVVCDDDNVGVLGAQWGVVWMVRYCCLDGFWPVPREDAVPARVGVNNGGGGRGKSGCCVAIPSYREIAVMNRHSFCSSWGESNVVRPVDTRIKMVILMT